MRREQVPVREWGFGGKFEQEAGCNFCGLVHDVALVQLTQEKVQMSFMARL